MTSDPRHWRLWDEGCAADEARNQFAIPFLTATIKRSAPTCVIDVGAGSGYVSRRLMGNLDHRNIAWVLVDDDPVACKWLIEAFDRHDGVRIQNSRVPPLPVNDESTLVVLSYTVLEMSLDELAGLVKSLAPGASLAMILPDVAEDVLQVSPDPNGPFWLEGSQRLSKTDKFSGDSYPFTAHRFEHLIETLTTSGVVVDRVEQYICNHEAKRHFGIAGRREASRSP